MLTIKSAFIMTVTIRVVLISRELELESVINAKPISAFPLSDLAVMVHFHLP
jgi:hypothetical protein